MGEIEIALQSFNKAANLSFKYIGEGNSGVI